MIGGGADVSLQLKFHTDHANLSSGVFLSLFLVYLYQCHVTNLRLKNNKSSTESFLLSGTRNCFFLVKTGSVSFQQETFTYFNLTT